MMIWAAFGMLSAGWSAAAELTHGTRETLRAAIEDLMATHGEVAPGGVSYLQRLDEVADGAELEALRKEVMLASPAVDFRSMLVVERADVNGGLPANWQSNADMAKTGHRNRILEFSLADGSLKPVHEPEHGEFVGDVDLDFDGGRILFSSIGGHGGWAVFEKDLATGECVEVTPVDEGVDFMDACYLPDGRIMFAATSGFQGVPCVGGRDKVANLHVLDRGTGEVRRLCFDQENNWCPTVLPNGKVMYLRWEYTDSAHYFSRVLMHMNPDGTNQKEYYGSNSYWPNSMFYARPLPGSSSKFVAVVSGHHGVRRAGELVVFDNALGRHEASGAIQRIPGAGVAVEAVTMDGLVNRSFPRFLHPWPLSDKLFLVSMSLDGERFGIYLVDVFDNMVPLLEAKRKWSYVEPVPLRKTVRPPEREDLVVKGESEAVFYIQDIYEGGGLDGVPRGTVKGVKVYKYEYAPRDSGGHYAIGMEGPWDVRSVLGTAPVNEDGSVMFRAPANTPVAFAPLDGEGKSLQMMRSWTTGMPGEVVSCIGCHESQNQAPDGRATLASEKPPVELEEWLGGPVRGFSFEREVQPVLDRHCIGCHTRRDAKEDGRPDFSEPTRSYDALHPYVRRNGPEGDYHLLTPAEFHADTSELMQLLKEGHHGVELDGESVERIVTWIDMNVPKYGTWTEAAGRRRAEEAVVMLERRKESREKYAGLRVDPEVVVNPYRKTEKFVKPRETGAGRQPDVVRDWPFGERAAVAMQEGRKPVALELGGGVTMDFRYVPAGSFVNGAGWAARVGEGFWMGACEVSLEQYRRFRPDHVNGVYDMHYKDQVDRGYYMNEPEFPVIRVSWDEAREFCAWLSGKTGLKVELPAGDEWEWACRAGAGTAMNYGAVDADFGREANLADVSMRKMAVKGVNPKPIPNPSPELDFIPKVATVNDGVLHLAKTGSYRANRWGLHDMHGNVAEWTDEETGDGEKVVRGGSWRDRPKRATAGEKVGYPAWQRVYNVGFRVVVRVDEGMAGQ
nr:SUMF1/EgtB/PvdO family nonheme iron enzyme [Verrucomicrobiota bacterium JB025]